LGQGAFAEVRLGINRLTGEQVAIKIVEKHNIGDHGVDQIYAELHFLENHKHFNIVQMLDFFDDQNAYYLVLEYVAGGEVFDFVLSNGKLREEEARHIFRQIVLGVEYCHQNHVVHRDLKLENVLLDLEGNVKIIDFNFCFNVTEHASKPPLSLPNMNNMNNINNISNNNNTPTTTICNNLTINNNNSNSINSNSINNSVVTTSTSGSTASCSSSKNNHNISKGKKQIRGGDAFGTLNYAAPEVLMGETHDFRADIWSLGIMLYVMLCGRYPFYDSTSQQRTFLKIRRGIYTFPPFLTKEAIDLIQMMLQTDPDSRFGIYDIKKHRWLKGSSFFNI